MEKTTYKKLSIKGRSKGAFLADIHLGVRAASTEWQENQRSYFDKFFIPWLKTQPLDEMALFILGDIFDDRKAINIEVGDLAIGIFTELGSLLPVYVISGNHDLYKKTNKGVTSLRSLEYIPGVKVIKEPTRISMASKSIIAIPYLGDISLENQCLIDNAECDYAFMHTDLAKMKFDNGMDIVRGVNADCFRGKIYSGHIHKRQSSGNMTYVGAPYHMSRMDINNAKGVYMLDFATGEQTFSPNDFSPLFQKIDIDTFAAMTTRDQLRYINNNYTDVIVYGDMKRYNLQEIYDLASVSEAKSLIVQYSKTAAMDVELAEEDDCSALSLTDLIHQTIDCMDLEESEREKLKIMSDNYYRACESELNAIV